MRGAMLWAFLLCAIPMDARADRVHLVGGAVIEGNASRVGEKVWVDVPSGQLSLPVASVVRIEESETDLERFEKRLAKLKPNDVKGLLSLATFCREHDMRARERELLQKVLVIDPQQSEARARLGYVKSAEGHWITGDEARRAQGLVPYRGGWVTQAELAQIERRAEEARLMTLTREKAEIELETKKVELAQKRLEAEQQARAQDAAAESALVPAYPSVFVVPGVVQGGGCAYGTCMPSGWKGPKAFPIPGVRDPRDMTFSIPGARDPRDPY